MPRKVKAQYAFPIASCTCRCFGSVHNFLQRSKDPYAFPNHRAILPLRISPRWSPVALRLPCRHLRLPLPGAADVSAPVGGTCRYYGFRKNHEAIQRVPVVWVVVVSKPIGRRRREGVPEGGVIGCSRATGGGGNDVVSCCWTLVSRAWIKSFCVRMTRSWASREACRFRISHVSSSSRLANSLPSKVFPSAYACQDPYLDVHHNIN